MARIWGDSGPVLPKLGVAGVRMVVDPRAMPTLSSSIVKHNVASVHDVEEALARQAMHGGDLVTNLLELSAVREAALAALLAESHTLAAAQAGELAPSGSDVLRLVPRDLARRFALYPLQRQGDALLVAVSEPLPAEVESDLSFSLGLRIEQCVALPVRIAQALARDYALPLDQRAERILAKLAGQPDPNPSVAPGPPERVAAQAEGSGEAAPRPGPIVQRPPLRDQVDFTAMARKEPRPRRLGPYTAAMAERDLMDAEDTDAVLRAFFDFASQFFEYAALFAIHGDLAEGRDAAGSGAPRARVISLGIPLDLPSSLAHAAASDHFALRSLGTGGLDGALARDLERRPGPQVLLLPIRVRKRPVLVLYGDHGSQDVQLDPVGQVISFAPLVSSRLEHLILKRKHAGGASLPPRAPARPKNAPLPRPEERAAALASALGVEEAPISSQPLKAASSGLMRPVISIGDLRRGQVPSGDSGGASPEAREAPREGSPAPSSVPLEPPDEGWDFAFSSRESATRPGVGTPPQKLELMAEPVAERQSDRQAGRSPSPSPEAPDISTGTAALDDELDFPPDSDGVPLAPASRSLAHSARPLALPQNSEELKLPTVIVDLANDCKALLDQLLAGSTTAGDKLVQVGDQAVAVLASSFPGPITAELRRGVGSAPSRASECGPVLRTLARIGVRAAPVLVVRTADADPNVRAWATRLLGEMPNEEAARAVVRRFVDDDQEVRRAALAAGRLMQSSIEARSMIQAGLAELLSDPHRPEEQRHALIEAIADLRDGPAVPTLLRLLEDDSPDIVRSAHWGLVVLSRQDHGLSAPAWAEWWRNNSGRHRIEWLIDALLHDSADIRRAAGDELKSTTKEYFGYYDDLPIAERQKAQSRYRNWWETRGKARFR